MSDREMIFSSCKSLKLGGIRSSIESTVTLATQESWSYDKLVCRLIALIGLRAVYPLKSLSKGGWINIGCYIFFGECG